MDVQDLNKCLRGELSAVETYTQALEKNRKKYGADSNFEQLSQMCNEHQQSAGELRGLINRLGGKAEADSGAWGAWSKTVMGAAKLFGDEVALKALKEGEESGVKDYQDALEDCDMPEVERTLNALCEKDRDHVRQLDRMMEAT